MDKEVPMARSEEEGQSVLLASSRTGETAREPQGGDEGQEGNSHAKGDEESASVNPAPKSKSNTKDKGRDGKRGRKRGRTYSLGEPIREAERRNKSTRRSARELGIEWPDDRCELSPVTKAHHFHQTTIVGGGFVFRCRHCHAIKWIPTHEDEAKRMGRLMHTHGKEVGYQILLDSHPKAKRLLSKIQDIQYLRRALSPEQFAVAVAAIILDREYPHDVEIKEEEIL